MKLCNYPARKRGALVGFPKCCIKAFKHGRHWYKLTKVEQRKIQASIFERCGYIPCKVCLKLNPIKVLAGITKRRSKRLLPFPQE